MTKQSTEYIYIFLPYKMGKGLFIRDGANHRKIENRVQAHQQKWGCVNTKERMHKIKKKKKKVLQVRG